MFCRNCGEQIENDVHFCPKCGYNIKQGTTENVSGRTRHGFTTFWLIVSLISFVITGSTYLFSPQVIIQYWDASRSLVLLFGIVSMVGVVGAILLLCWKKIGFWIYIGIAVASFFLNMALRLSIAQCLFGLVGIAIMWGVLQIRKNNKTTWEQLE
jgi:hypothetical protein